MHTALTVLSAGQIAPTPPDSLTFCPVCQSPLTIIFPMSRPNRPPPLSIQGATRADAAHTAFVGPRQALPLGPVSPCLCTYSLSKTCRTLHNMLRSSMDLKVNIQRKKKAWACHTANELRKHFPSSTSWVYLDSSAGSGGYSSGATIYLPSGTCLVLRLPSPFQSSGGAEFWAAIMFLCWAARSLPLANIIVLGDKQQIVNLFDSNTRPPLPSTTTDGTWSWAVNNTLNNLPDEISVKSAWIKGHARFLGNECRDAYSKWIAYATEWSTSLLPPAPFGRVS